MIRFFIVEKATENVVDYYMTRDEAENELATWPDANDFEIIEAAE